MKKWVSPLLSLVYHYLCIALYNMEILSLYFYKHNKTKRRIFYAIEKTG